MLNKSDMRPAYATVGQDSSASNRSKMNCAAFSAAQTEDDDFNAFGDASAKSHAPAPKSRPSQSSQQPRNPKKKKSSTTSSKTVIIVAAVIVALILVIALFVAVFSSPGKNILREDDAYAAYVDSNDVYHVLYNGKEIRHNFEGKVALTPAKDCSFAYIFEEIVSEEGTNAIRMYILKGKKLDSIETDADSIVDCAEYEPGIIFKKGNEVQFYSTREFETLSNNPGASNFVISGDASTVVFTEPVRSANVEESSTQVKYFRNAGFNNIGETAGLIPVAVSNDGKYVYATDVTGSFYYLKVTKRGDEYEQKTVISNSTYAFGRVTELNADGTEVIFTYIDSSSEVGNTASFIYKIGDKSPSSIASGSFYYTPIDKEVVCPATFIDSALTVDRTVITEDEGTLNITSTYYYTRKGARKLADSEGTFSPDGKYFYYLDYGKLYRVALSSNDFENDKEEVTTADAFLLTEKGDIYTYTKPSDNTPGSIRWRSADKTSSKLISTKADLNCMYLCGNSVYFSETVDGNVKLYKSANGAVKEEVTFKNTIPASFLTIVMGTGDKGYAYFVDIDGNTQLLYTSNAKAFDLVSGCTFCSVNGISSGTTAPAPDTNNDSNGSNNSDSTEGGDEDSAG